jgi:hypothetical protein
MSHLYDFGVYRLTATRSRSALHFSGFGVAKLRFIDGDNVLNGPNNNLSIEDAHMPEPFPIRLFKIRLYDVSRMKLL